MVDGPFLMDFLQSKVASQQSNVYLTKRKQRTKNAQTIQIVSLTLEFSVATMSTDIILIQLSFRSKKKSYTMVQLLLNLQQMEKISSSISQV